MACGSSIYESGEEERESELEEGDLNDKGDGESDNNYDNEDDDDNEEGIEEEKQMQEQIRANKLRSLEIKRAIMKEQDCMSI
jgi:hypothetical protein